MARTTFWGLNAHIGWKVGSIAALPRCRGAKAGITVCGVRRSVPKRQPGVADEIRDGVRLSTVLVKVSLRGLVLCGWCALGWGGSERALVQKQINRIASELHVNPRVVEAVAEVESGLNPRAQSWKGAVGIMQVMPATGRAMGGTDLSDIRGNIVAGVSYLRYVGLLFHGDLKLALAAYNAGPGAVLRYGGVPPYVETQRYIQAVVARYFAQGTSAGVRWVLPPAAGSVTVCGAQRIGFDKSGRLVVRPPAGRCAGERSR